jgi:hypothetical protein
MSTSVELLDRLETELLTAQDQAAGRETDLADLLVKTQAHWQSWAERWDALVRLLEERRAALEGKGDAALAIVNVAEAKLEETEVALREWLATAAVTAQEAGRS